MKSKKDYQYDYWQSKIEGALTKCILLCHERELSEIRPVILRHHDDIIQDMHMEIFSRLIVGQDVSEHTIISLMLNEIFDLHNDAIRNIPFNNKYSIHLERIN